MERVEASVLDEFLQPRSLLPSDELFLHHYHSVTNTLCLYIRAERILSVSVPCLSNLGPEAGAGAEDASVTVEITGF